MNLIKILANSSHLLKNFQVKERRKCCTCLKDPITSFHFCFYTIYLLVVICGNLTNWKGAQLLTFYLAFNYRRRRNCEKARTIENWNFGFHLTCCLLENDIASRRQCWRAVEVVMLALITQKWVPLCQRFCPYTASAIVLRHNHLLSQVWATCKSLRNWMGLIMWLKATISKRQDLLAFVL